MKYLNLRVSKTRIWFILNSAIAKKNTQTTGVVLDLSQTSVTAKQLGNVLERVQGTGAKNINHVVIMPK